MSTMIIYFFWEKKTIKESIEPINNKVSVISNIQKKLWNDDYTTLSNPIKNTRYKTPTEKHQEENDNIQKKLVFTILATGDLNDKDFLKKQQINFQPDNRLRGTNEQETQEKHYEEQRKQREREDYFSQMQTDFKKNWLDLSYTPELLFTIKSWEKVIINQQQIRPSRENPKSIYYYLYSWDVFYSVAMEQNNNTAYHEENSYRKKYRLYKNTTSIATLSESEINYGIQFFRGDYYRIQVQEPKDSYKMHEEYSVMKNNEAIYHFSSEFTSYEPILAFLVNQNWRWIYYIKYPPNIPENPWSEKYAQRKILHNGKDITKKFIDNPILLDSSLETKQYLSYLTEFEGRTLLFFKKNKQNPYQYYYDGEIWTLPYSDLSQTSAYLNNLYSELPEIQNNILYLYAKIPEWDKMVQAYIKTEAVPLKEDLPILTPEWPLKLTKKEIYTGIFKGLSLPKYPNMKMGKNKYYTANVYPNRDFDIQTPTKNIYTTERIYPPKELTEVEKTYQYKNNVAKSMYIFHHYWDNYEIREQENKDPDCDFRTKKYEAFRERLCPNTVYNIIKNWKTIFTLKGLQGSETNIKDIIINPTTWRIRQILYSSYLIQDKTAPEINGSALEHLWESELIANGTNISILQDRHKIFGLNQFGEYIFFFFKPQRASKIHYYFRWKTYQTTLDDIFHDGCCSTEIFNIQYTKNWEIFFFGKQGNERNYYETQLIR